MVDDEFYSNATQPFVGAGKGPRPSPSSMSEGLALMASDRSVEMRWAKRRP